MSEASKATEVHAGPAARIDEPGFTDGLAADGKRVPVALVAGAVAILVARIAVRTAWASATRHPAVRIASAGVHAVREHRADPATDAA